MPHDRSREFDGTTHAANVSGSFTAERTRHSSIRTGVHQHCRRVNVKVFASKEERVAIVRVYGVHVGSVLEEELAHGRVAVFCGVHQGCLATEARVWISPAAQGTAHSYDVAFYAALDDLYLHRAQNG